MLEKNEMEEDGDVLHRFSELPLSKKTTKALDKWEFVNMTDIQSSVIPLALENKDILGSAKTGSGKTLAFVIPIIEILTREEWNRDLGLGALVITPTRELALQIFQVLRKVGSYHSVSAGLVIGGKDIQEEADLISEMNILVCTPGRLLQHMDQTCEFNFDSLRVLVLDEADKILEMGFADTLDAILQNLPPIRQTLLFSATLNSSVRDLGRLNLKDPVVVAVHESCTPDTLKQHFIRCKPQEKIEILFSFARHHPKSKILVFVSSCKQSRFMFELFYKLRSSLPSFCLHGRQKQGKRFNIFNSFCQLDSALLFCTDIASRGLDFPNVDWVIQLDCPDTVETYVHRVGRTARYNKSGNSLLFVQEFEEHFVEELKSKNISIEETTQNHNKILPIQTQIGSICSQHPDIKYLAKRSLVSYFKSLYLKYGRQNFPKIDTKGLSESFGLHKPPRLRFLKDAQVSSVCKKEMSSGEEYTDEEDVLIQKKDSEYANIQPVSCPSIPKRKLKRKLQSGHKFNTHIIFDAEKNKTEDELKPAMSADRDKDSMEELAIRLLGQS